jgi:YHS domain-containing protein
MAKDPVCGMQINESQTAGKSEYQGQTFYFCSPGCKQRFDQNPDRYADQRATHTIQANESGPCIG